MLELKTEILIDASANKIWNILSNFKNYPQWNSFIREISGKLAEGKTLSILITPAGKKGMRFSPTLIKVEKNREIRWAGKFLWAPLFRGEHYFILEPINAHQTKFIHGEVFTGLLVPLMEKDLRGATYDGFVQMNEALKELSTL